MREHRILELDGASVDLAQGVLRRGGGTERLSTKEVEVLRYLAEHPSRPISHEELLENVWGHSRLASTQPVYSVMKRLRKKVDGHGEHRHIVGVHGVGYRFELPPRRAPTPSSAMPQTPSRARMTSFVGREPELACVEETFASGARLVSLVGPGGAGKTRIALELAERATRRGVDVIFCDLSDTRTLADLIRVVATQVGARIEECGAPPIESALRARNAILVLDNLEQLVEHAANEAMRWAEITPLLVTSRERLAVRGEHVVPIGPLDPSHAAELFRERCRMAGLEVEREDSRIERIVDRLDRLPLAIELAASQAGAVALSSLAESLERPTLGMTPSIRGIHARHATLRASVEWSWSLLDEQERSFLSRCSVFVGGFTAEAAATVVGVEGASVMLQRMIERSLVRRDHGPGAPRLRLYEAVRELAAERLDDGGATERRHADWALQLAREAGALRIVSPPDAYSRLVPESENLLAAFRRTIGPVPAVAGELALALDLVFRRGAAAKERREALDAAVIATRGSLRVRVRLARGRTEQQLGERGRKLLEETVSLAEAERDIEPGLVMEAERLLAACLAAMGEPGPALPRLEAVYARTDAVPAIYRGRVALELGRIHRLAAGLARARELLGEAERVLEDEGDLAEAARAAFAMSHVSREEGSYEKALSDLERARTYLEECGDEVGLAGLDVERGILLASISQVDEARAALSAGAIAHRRLGLPASELRARDWLVLALLGGGRMSEARAEVGELRRLGRELGRTIYEPERALGAVLFTEQRYAEADEVLTSALAILEAGGEATIRGHVLSLRGLNRILMDRLVEAEADLRECAAIHAERGRSTATARSAATLALVRELAAPREDTDEALATAEATMRGRPSTDPDTRERRLRHAIIDVTRARRRAADQAVVRTIADEARAAVLDASGAPPDWPTRCSLLLLDHALVRPLD